MCPDIVECLLRHIICPGWGALISITEEKVGQHIWDVASSEGAQRWWDSKPAKTLVLVMIRWAGSPPQESGVSLCPVRTWEYHVDSMPQVNSGSEIRNVWSHRKQWSPRGSVMVGRQEYMAPALGLLLAHCVALGQSQSSQYSTNVY